MDVPFIDEHSQRVNASKDAAWTALVGVIRGFAQNAGFTQLLGCEPACASPAFGAQVGDTIPGFRVTESEPGRRLTLRGRHRFSTYALTFELADDRISARTYAAFPGVRGRIYRAAVISSGAHAVVTRHLLGKVARAARARQ